MQGDDQRNRRRCGRDESERRHDFVSEIVPLGRLPFVQAQLLSRHLRGDLDGYPAGNHFQLFDLEDDPNELVDLTNDPSYAQTIASLKTLLPQELYGDDLWAVSGETFVGLDVPDTVPGPELRAVGPVRPAQPRAAAGSRGRRRGDVTRARRHLRFAGAMLV